MNSQDQNSQKNEHKSEKDDGPQTLAILQDIRKGLTDPKSFCPDVRRLLVSFLMAEGQSTAEIAHLLKVSDKTIERDKKALREENTITKDPKLLEQIVGGLISEADLCIQRIRKFQRDSNASPAAKMEGEQRCFQIKCNLIEKLQSLGFLPTAAQKIEADLTHHAASSLTLEEIQLEARRLKQIEESLPSEGTKQVDSAIETNEIVNKGGNNHETTK